MVGGVLFGVMHTCFTSRTLSSQMQEDTMVGGVCGVNNAHLFHLTLFGEMHTCFTLYTFFTDAVQTRSNTKVGGVFGVMHTCFTSRTRSLQVEFVV